jgi:hypothetical protein
MIFRATKDPGADLDYTIDWSAWLVNAETITTSSWSVPSSSGLTTHDPAIDGAGQKTTVWLKAGTVKAAPYLVTNHVKTSENREDVRSILVTVELR